MVLAVQKFLSSQTMTVSVTKSIDDTRQPMVFVCPKKKKFNSSRANELGYRFSSKDFLYGIVNNASDSLSWEGTNGMPYDEIIKELYPASDNVYSINLRPSPYLPWHFKPFEGFCREVKTNLTSTQNQNLLQIISKEEFQVYISDPNKFLFFSLVSDLFVGDSILTEKIMMRLYTIDIEEIQWMKDVGECYNYGTDETYADCVANFQGNQFSPLLNCTIPWMTGSNKTRMCRGKIQTSKEVFGKAVEKFNSALITEHFKTFDYSKVCPKPCNELRFTSKFKNMYSSILPEFHGIGMLFKTSVKETEELLAYGLVDLAVEIGSSLGLWVGLSALGVFDVAIVAGGEIRKYIG